jgi:DNA-binding IclR family transcriptional regulator
MSEVNADAEPKDRQFISALAKGLQVLRCFSTHGPELGASEIAAILGMPQPTIWRICHTLLELGYLVTDADRSRMRLGLPVLGLGYSALSSLTVETLAVGEMEEIASRYEGAVSLGAPDGLEMVYIQRCQGSAIIHANLRVGSRVPMASSGTGWAYLAALAPASQAEYFAALAQRHTAQWQSLEGPLKKALELFSSTGFVTNLGHMHPRINSVAVPVWSPDGQSVLSLSCGGINDVFTPERLPQIGRDLLGLAERLGPSLAFNVRPVSLPDGVGAPQIQLPAGRR